MDFFIIKKDKVSSTNDVLKQHAAEYENGTVLIAKEQTAGKGRTGRSFYSPPTGLYFSILLKDIEDNSASLTVKAAVAVMKGIYDTFGIETQVKWVNDIILDGRKICGILTEGAFSGDKLSYAVVGIGINVGTETFPDEIKNTAGSLNKSCGRNDELLDKILENFTEIIEKDSEKKYLDFYKKNCLTLNKKVRLISQENFKEEAFVSDIGENAELIVKKENGEVKKVFYGEAIII